MKKRASIRTVASGMMVLLSLFLIGFAVSTALADDESGPAQIRSRTEAQMTTQDAQGDALRQRIRERIEDETGLQTQERERLRSHLEECDRLGLDDATVRVLFSENIPLRAQIRLQERVLTLAREGLPVEPVVQKLQEGLRKGANVEALERACNKLGEYVRAAHQFMKQARESGITPGDENAERERVREMATYMWRGLGEADMEQLRERAQQRLRDGSCTTEQLTGAAETATRLGEIGIERKRAVQLAGEALQHGYTVREMRRLVWTVMTAHTHGGSSDKVIDSLERGIRNQQQLSQMIQEMWQRGWMGPAEQQGGHSPVDNSPGSGYGGHQQDNGTGGSEGSGGGGGSDQTGGGSIGDHDGQGGQPEGGTGR